MESVDTTNILKSYLGEYFSKVPQWMVPILKNQNTKQTINFVTDQKYVKSILTYLLIKDGRQYYKVILSYELIDAFLGNIPDYNSIYDYSGEDLLIIIHMFNIENKRMSEFLSSVINHRMFLNKPTWILSISPYKDITIPTVTVLNNSGKSHFHKGVNDVL